MSDRRPSLEAPLARARAGQVPVTLDEMIETALDEACRIEAGQRAAVEMGARAEPHPGQMRRALAFREIEMRLRKMSR